MAENREVATNSLVKECELMAVTGYCLKDKKNVEIKNPQNITMKNGKPAITGTCPDCGTKIFKIGKSS